jgi:hypothetical protein
MVTVVPIIESICPFNTVFRNEDLTPLSAMSQCTHILHATNDDMKVYTTSIVNAL